MKFETDLVRGKSAALSEDELPDNVGHIKPTAPARKDLRDAVLFTTDDALAVQRDLRAVANGMSNVMFAAAITLNQFEQEPNVDDLVSAASRLLQSAHSIVDRGLMIPNWEEVRCGVVMMELIARGTFCALGLPYEEVLKSVWASGDAYFVLVQSGLIKGESDEQEGGADKQTGWHSGATLGEGDGPTV